MFSFYCVPFVPKLSNTFCSRTNGNCSLPNQHFLASNRKCTSFGLIRGKRQASLLTLMRFSGRVLGCHGNCGLSMRERIVIHLRHGFRRRRSFRRRPLGYGGPVGETSVMNRGHRREDIFKDGLDQEPITGPGQRQPVVERWVRLLSRAGFRRQRIHLSKAG